MAAAGDVILNSMVGNVNEGKEGKYENAKRFVQSNPRGHVGRRHGSGGSRGLRQDRGIFERVVEQRELLGELVLERGVHRDAFPVRGFPQLFFR